MAKAGRKPDHGDEKLYALRHSTAHVMAGAVLELFPEAKFGFGPPVTDGFYYDFDLPRPLTPDDLGKIEAKMHEVVKQDAPFVHRDMGVAEALKFFGERKQDYKVDQIKKLAEKGADEDSDDEVQDGRVSVYQHNGFVDLCRGPHVEKTGKIGPFKLLSIAGAYWRGNERNPQLQRIYGTVWPDQKQLDDYLKRLQEIERRDHRVLGKELELFRIDEELGSGLVLWLPNLSIVREELETWWRKIHRERGYTLVYTPHIAHEKIYQRSGHLEKYGENMYGPLLLDEAGAGVPGEGAPGREATARRAQRFWIKPMNCPGHIKAFQSKIHSYRDLPMRIGELGTVYRYERGGTLHGMLRVRGFTQDDSHIFCSWAQAQEEIGKVFDLALEFLSVFGYTEPSIYLSTRPEKRLGSDELWDKAEEALRTALGIREVPYKVDEGGGVFYAPKIDIKVHDAIGREWQGATVQIDLNLPERFDVTFVNEKGERERAVMIHRVLFGSLERFVGGLIEHYAGNFPLWLNWEQVAVIPVRESALDYARDIAKRLRAEDFRVHLDEQAGDLRNRVKEAQRRKASYMLVVGDKEAAASTVSVRRRGSRDEERGVALDAFLDRIKKERDTKALPADFAQHEPTAGDAMP
ncbi:MAG: threonine--tRNA ligase [Chloroflexota bacterium]|nr:threonine--tRNA ligase [Chloroflexota bacterium]